MPFGIQPWHIVVIVAVALLIFGPSKLPELSRTVGKTINEFRNGTNDLSESFKGELTQGNREPRVTVDKMPALTDNPAGVYCTQCGAQNPGDAHFCKNCGKALEA